MSISRRDFLKNAGVAVLAVAAAGVLAGCSKDEIPEIPGVSKEVDVRFEVNGEWVASGRIVVPADATVIAANEVKLPKYPVEYVNGEPVKATKKYALAEGQEVFEIQPQEDPDKTPYPTGMIVVELVVVDAD